PEFRFRQASTSPAWWSKNASKAGRYSSSAAGGRSLRMARTQRSGARGAALGMIEQVALHRALAADLEGGPRAESEGPLGAARVETAAGLAIGAARVPHEVAGIARGLADEIGEVAHGNFRSRAEVDGQAVGVALGGQEHGLRGVLHVEEVARRVPRAPAGDRRRVSALRLEALADQGGNDVGSLEVEIVTRPVEIRGEQVDGVEAVLFPVGLRLHDQHLLGEAVGGVGLIRVAVPEVVFAEGHERG